MDVVLVLVAALILCLSYETVSYNEPQLNEQFHSVVERGSRYAKVARFEQFTEFLKGEMSVEAINGVKDGVSLRSLSVLVPHEIVIEDSPHFLFYCVVGHSLID